MTTAQKIIKLVANAFAIFLIVAIISGLLSAGFSILGAIGVIDNKNELLEDLKTISENNIDEISSLKLDLKSSNLQIKTGEKFEVKTNNPSTEYTNTNGNIKIQDNNAKWHFGNNELATIIIYLPENKTLDEITMNIGAGTISSDTLEVQNLSLDLGAGNITIENLIVSKNAKINGGAGNININSGKISNVDLDLGIGETNIKADITGKSKIDTGIGTLNLYLMSAQENYKLHIDKGVGHVKFNNDIISDDTDIGNGDNYIKINGGIGDIKIETKNL